MPQVILPGKSYQRPGHIWDHTVVAQNASPLSTIPLFSVGIGGTGYGVTGKTFFDTNVQTGNRQNPGEAFVLCQMGFKFNPNMKLSDIFLMLNQYYFQLEIQTRGAVFAEGHLGLYPSGSGISGVTTNNAESVWDVGVPNILAARIWGTQDGFQFSDQQYFGVNVKSETAVPTMLGPNGLDLWCYLDGLKTTLVHG